MIRVGIGYDVHKLAEGEKMILGGVDIPHEKGTVGHSDADVLIHAIIDALLGAAGLRDIGYHFPDTDPQYKGISSLILLEHTAKLLLKEGWTVGNIDAVIALQRPKIKPFIVQMQENIAKAMCIKPGQISVKATTTEHLGFEGREEGVSVYAVALLEKNN